MFAREVGSYFRGNRRFPSATSVDSLWGHRIWTDMRTRLVDGKESFNAPPRTATHETIVFAMVWQCSSSWQYVGKQRKI